MQIWSKRKSGILTRAWLVCGLVLLGLGCSGMFGDAKTREGRAKSQPKVPPKIPARFDVKVTQLEGANRFSPKLQFEAPPGATFEVEIKLQFDTKNKPIKHTLTADENGKASLEMQNLFPEHYEVRAAKKIYPRTKSTKMVVEPRPATLSNIGVGTPSSVELNCAVVGDAPTDKFVSQWIDLVVSKRGMIRARLKKPTWNHQYKPEGPAILEANGDIVIEMNIWKHPPRWPTQRKLEDIVLGDLVKDGGVGYISMASVPLGVFEDGSLTFKARLQCTAPKVIRGFMTRDLLEKAWTFPLDAPRRRPLNAVWIAARYSKKPINYLKDPSFSIVGKPELPLTALDYFVVSESRAVSNGKCSYRGSRGGSKRVDMTRETLYVSVYDRRTGRKVKETTIKAKPPVCKSTIRANASSLTSTTISRKDGAARIRKILSALR